MLKKGGRRGRHKKQPLGEAMQVGGERSVKVLCFRNAGGKELQGEERAPGNKVSDVKTECPESKAQNVLGEGKKRDSRLGKREKFTEE